MTCDSKSISAQANCLLSCIPEGAMQAAQLVLLCQIADTLNQLLGASNLYTGDWGGNLPPFNPPQAIAQGRDTGTGQSWWWYSGGWHA